VDDAQWEAFEARQRRGKSVRAALDHRVSPPDADKWAAQIGTRPPGRTIRLRELIKRPEVRLEHLRDLAPELPHLSPTEIEDLEAELKFDGYIQRQERVAAQLQKADDIRLPQCWDEVEGLSTEVIEKLTEVCPRTLGAASRIPGITPAALAAIMFYLKKTGSSQSEPAA